MPSVDLNWEGTSDDGFSLPEPGVYLAEVGSVEVKRSAVGDQYFSVKLNDAKTHGALCWDTLMLGGKGKSIGMAKLRQLGVEEGTKSLDPNSLYGRRVKVSIMHGEFEGRKQAKVDIRADGFKCGYLAEDGVADAAPAKDEDSPW